MRTDDLIDCGADEYAMPRGPGVATPGYAKEHVFDVRKVLRVGYWETYYHLVWTTKNREPFLRGRVEALVDRCFRDISEELGTMLRAIGNMDDHVHIAVSIPPRTAIPTYVREIKIRSTHAIRSARLLHPDDEFSWQREYGLFTFGRQSLDDVVGYVKNQRHHHLTGTTRPYFEITDSRDIPTIAPKERPLA
jgi:REP element-mobilizing transposase RayT